MAAKRTPTAPQRLIERLPPVRGRLSENAPLAQLTWLRVGGPAEVMFRPADVEDLAQFLARKPKDVKVTVIGVASNLLIRDGGVKGVVVRLGRGFVEIKSEGEEIAAGAGALDLNVALSACAAGIAGLEFLSGIPGTIGGGLRMNAGAYGAEFKDVLVAAAALDAKGKRRELTAAEMELSYRHCGVAEDWVFVSARFKGKRDEAQAIGARMATIQAQREESQPIRARTGGSTFANPPGHKAWELIDKAGCRGLKLGGAQVSPKHANFLINTGEASAADVENLGEEVRRRVLEKSGVSLEWEIRRIGVAPAPEAAP
ncbi:MAG TPA: UDP-N-acetylmuramate dehydrogenase [Stellaceae bacterium]|nr:UDP-N-acetylmuramate dehydrogenase [Stellaceae bacterium]